MDLGVVTKPVIAGVMETETKRLTALVKAIYMMYCVVVRGWPPIEQTIILLPRGESVGYQDATVTERVDQSERVVSHRGH